MISLKSVPKEGAIRLLSKPYLWKRSSITRSYDDGFAIDFTRIEYPYYQHRVFKSCYSQIHYEGQPKKVCVDGFVEWFKLQRTI